MNNVEIYDGVTEEDLLEEFDIAKKRYTDSVKECDNKKKLIAGGVILTALNLFAFCNMAKNKSAFTLIHAVYSVFCLASIKNNFKEMKKVKEKKIVLKQTLDDLEEKMPIETDCVVK